LDLADADMKLFTDALCPFNFELICLFAAITCQYDVSPENLMVKATASARGEGQLELMLIDTPCAWPDFDELELELCDGDEETDKSYWYPAMFFLPAMKRSLSAKNRAFLKSLTPEKLRQVADLCKKASDVSMDQQVPSSEAVEGGVRRLIRLQNGLNENPEASLHDLLFLAVPCWARDWECQAAEIGLQAYMTLVETGQMPLKYQALRYAYAGYRQLMAPQVAVLATVVIAAIVARYKFSR
jgi:hypothetical protein